MLKGRAFLFAALTAGVFAFAASACESESGSGFTEGSEDAGAPGDTGPGFNIDGNANLEDSRPPLVCTPQLPATFAPAWIPPTKTAACTPALLEEYYDTCLANAGAPDAGATCDAWLAANKACGDCIEPDDNSGPIQWHRGRDYYTLNVAGCLAIERGEMADDQCPAVYNASFQCQRESCKGCQFTTQAEFEQFSKCQGDARTSGCKTYHDKVNPTCGAGFTGPDGGAYSCFRPANEGQRSHFIRVEGIFCGAN